MVELYLDIYRLISLRCGMMIDTTELHTLMGLNDLDLHSTS